MGRRRQVIDVPGVAHGTMPIPMGVRIGQLVFSSGIHGLDPQTQRIPEDPARQVALAFQHMRTIVENAGGSTDDIGMVIFNLAADEYRPLVHAEWVAMFPHDDDRPARNTHIMPLGMGMIIHILMTAAIE
ncbi:RidA family protein [Polymorphospora lycopeni]|uniref:Rid family hydrolase n=1 Tax=Polymorphospora lycopeni TaxID=3140240 RepID=A0ABV5CVJ9_9ACTN